MSLNKFTNIEKNKPLNLKIGCKKLECNDARIGTLETDGPLLIGKLQQYQTVSVSNTALEFSLFSNSGFFGSREFQPNEIKPGRIYKMRVVGDIVSLSGESITFRLYLGPTATQVKLIEFQTSPPFGSAQKQFSLEFNLIAHTDNPNDKLSTTALFDAVNNAGAVYNNGQKSDVIFDFFNTLQEVDITAQWTSASNANILNVQQIQVERLR